MSSTNILHWSNTPLVGSPSNISMLINSIDSFSSKHIVEKDYPNNGMLYKEYTKESLMLENSDKLNQDIIVNFIEDADIIHVHNSISEKNLKNIFDLNKNCDFIYHIHSPLKEGPLFFPHYKKFEGIFKEFLVVSQYQPRIYQNFTPVPNIIAKTPSIRLLKDDEIIRVLYSPTHLRPGRWNNKYYKEMVEVLESLDKLGLIEYINAKNMKPDTLFEIRRTCHISIDEIVTGSFHQVSLESLVAGNLTINAADFFTRSSFQLSIGSKDELPFFYTNMQNFRESILEIIGDYQLIRNYQLKSFDYAKKNLVPNELAKIYQRVYERVCRNEK